MFMPVSGPFATNKNNVFKTHVKNTTAPLHSTVFSFAQRPGVCWILSPVHVKQPARPTDASDRHTL